MFFLLIHHLIGVPLAEQMAVLKREDGDLSCVRFIYGATAASFSRLLSSLAEECGF